MPTRSGLRRAGAPRKADIYSAGMLAHDYFHAYAAAYMRFRHFLYAHISALWACPMAVVFDIAYILVITGALYKFLASFSFYHFHAG